MTFSLLLAALIPVLAQLQGVPAEPTPDIKDIAPPVDVFPYPPWMVWSVAAAGVLLIGVVVWLLINQKAVRPPTLPPNPQSVALRRLEALRLKVNSMEPYAFSIAVCDVLREYIEARYGLRARQLTSPEFLASISSSTRFSQEDRVLLEQFLERVDLIKFARIDATTEDCENLLTKATEFVRGGRI